MSSIRLNYITPLLVSGIAAAAISVPGQATASTGDSSAARVAPLALIATPAAIGLAPVAAADSSVAEKPGNAEVTAKPAGPTFPGRQLHYPWFDYGFNYGLGGGRALALARPMPTVPTAACHSGREENVFTMTCAPIKAHNPPKGFTTTAANPEIPELGGVPCTGSNSGPCIGISENQAAAGPQPVPRSTISARPILSRG